jgi:hypothetical protein
LARRAGWQDSGVAERRVGVAERRARLGLRHGLAAEGRAADPAGVARQLVALHSTDAASVYLAVCARLPGVDVAAIGAALYEQRTVVRMLGMRRTVFVVPAELVPVVHESSTRAVAEVERRKLVTMLADAGLTAEPDQWLRRVEEATVQALAARGEALVAELGDDVPELRQQIRMARGKAYEGQVGVGTRVMFLLAADGRVVRGRPRGSWLSSQYRWAPTETWLPGQAPDWPVDAARAELVRRWLAAFGPGTRADLKWWTGWTMGQVTQALAGLDTVEVELAGGGSALLLAADADPVPAPAPWVALLPALDPTPMGWTGRAWYLADHAGELFDRSGNIGPTVWADGRIVGGWAQRTDGEIAHHLLEDIGTEATAEVEAQADRLARWLGPVRITPRFRTPLERKLGG